MDLRDGIRIPLNLKSNVPIQLPKPFESASSRREDPVMGELC